MFNPDDGSFSDRQKHNLNSEVTIRIMVDISIGIRYVYSVSVGILLKWSMINTNRSETGALPRCSRDCFIIDWIIRPVSKVPHDALN